MTDYPYAGTSGWSGGSTSKERQEWEDATGVTGWRSRQVYDLLRNAGRAGATDREVQAALNIGHGASSGTLTRLHKGGHIERLARRRNRNQVYVLAKHAVGQELSPYRPNGGRAELQARIDAAVGIIDQSEPKTWHEVVQFRSDLLRVLGGDSR